MHLSSTINLGQHFKKKLYTTNKTDIISTNSFSRHTKKNKEMSLLPLKFYNCAKTIHKNE